MTTDDIYCEDAITILKPSMYQLKVGDKTIVEGMLVMRMYEINTAQQSIITRQNELKQHSSHTVTTYNSLHVSIHTWAKVSRNAVLGPGNLSLERSGCKIIGFYSRNPCSWAQQVILIR